MKTVDKVRKKFVDKLVDELEMACREWRTNKWTGKEWLERLRVILKWYPFN